MPDEVLLHRDGPVATIELNRPDALNAWDDALGDGLFDAVAAVGEDPAVRAVIVTGAGRAFSAGADLRSITADGPKPDVEALLRDRYHPILVGLRRMSKPVVAAVNGAAAGIGCSLALCCDLVLAAESASFSLAFVHIGLVPDGGVIPFVCERAGAGRALEMAMLGERVGAQQALAWGLANRVVPDPELRTAAAELAARLAAGPAGAHAGAKSQVERWALERLPEHLGREARAQQDAVDAPDFAEGVAAFLEKRPARFAGS